MIDADLLAQYADNERTFNECMDKIWGAIYPDNPTGWQYPAMVVRHVQEVVKERDAANARAERLAALLARTQTWLRPFRLDPEAAPLIAEIRDALAQQPPPTGGHGAETVDR